MRPCPRGCTGERSTKTRCPLCGDSGEVRRRVRTERILDARIRYFLKTYADYRQHGVLPVEGGTGDMPAWWMRASRVMDNELALIENERMEALKRQQKNQGRS